LLGDLAALIMQLDDVQLVGSDIPVHLIDLRGRYAKQLEDAGEGAIVAASIDEIVSFLGNYFSRKLKPLMKSRWAHDPCLFACAPPRPRRRPRDSPGACRQPPVLCGRSDLAEFFLHRPRRA
jgi:hypothetical protein